MRLDQSERFFFFSGRRGNFLTNQGPKQVPKILLTMLWPHLLIDRADFWRLIFTRTKQNFDPLCLPSQSIKPCYLLQFVGVSQELQEWFLPMKGQVYLLLLLHLCFVIPKYQDNRLHLLIGFCLSKRINSISGFLFGIFISLDLNNRFILHRIGCIRV